MSDAVFQPSYRPDPAARQPDPDAGPLDRHALDPTARRLDLRELEMDVTDELALAEASRPDDPVVESDAGWRPNPTEVKAYEARLLALRAAAEVIDNEDGTEVISESVEIAIEADDSSAE